MMMILQARMLGLIATQGQVTLADILSYTARADEMSPPRVMTLIGDIARRQKLMPLFAILRWAASDASSSPIA